MIRHQNNFGQPIGFPVKQWEERSYPPRSSIRGTYCQVVSLYPEIYTEPQSISSGTEGGYRIDLKKGPQTRSINVFLPQVRKILKRRPGAYWNTCLYMQILFVWQHAGHLSISDFSNRIDKRTNLLFRCCPRSN